MEFGDDAVSSMLRARAGLEKLVSDLTQLPRSFLQRPASAAGKARFIDSLRKLYAGADLSRCKAHDHFLPTEQSDSTDLVGQNLAASVDCLLDEMSIAAAADPMWNVKAAVAVAQIQDLVSIAISSLESAIAANAHRYSSMGGLLGNSANSGWNHQAAA